MSDTLFTGCVFLFSTSRYRIAFSSSATRSHRRAEATHGMPLFLGAGRAACASASIHLHPPLRFRWWNRRTAIMSSNACALFRSREHGRPVGVSQIQTRLRESSVYSVYPWSFKGAGGHCAISKVVGLKNVDYCFQNSKG